MDIIDKIENLQSLLDLCVEGSFNECETVSNALYYYVKPALDEIKSDLTGASEFGEMFESLAQTLPSKTKKKVNK